MITKKKRPVIAVDVDGVLRNNLSIMVDMYNKECGVNLHPEDVKEFLVDVSFPLIKEKLGVDASDYFFKQHAKELFLDAPSYWHAAYDINRLKSAADVIIVTYQKGYLNKKYTLEWLDNYGIEPNGICFLKDKTLVHCDALVDDNDWNFLGTHVSTSVLVTRPYNENLDLGELITKTNSKQIIRVDNFSDFVLGYMNGDITL